ncbi:MAG: response regulator transcription factor [Anaerolineae bacterium]|nr:response regulator transcription factor [Anaerolineae bacterium]
MEKKTSKEYQLGVVIIEKQALIRAGLVLMVDSRLEMRVLGETGDIAGSYELVEHHQPDIILLGMDATEGITPNMIPSLLKRSHQSRVIVLSTQSEEESNLEALKHGALGIVFYSDTPAILGKAIRKVVAGEAWVERSLIANVLHTLADGNHPAPNHSEKDQIDELTLRERDVIQLIGRGFKNQQIAEKLCLSESTIRHHLTSIYHKLGVSSRLELLVYANHNTIT